MTISIQERTLSMSAFEAASPVRGTIRTELATHPFLAADILADLQILERAPFRRLALELPGLACILPASAAAVLGTAIASARASWDESLPLVNLVSRLRWGGLRAEEYDAFARSLGLSPETVRLRKPLDATPGLVRQSLQLCGDPQYEFALGALVAIIVAQSVLYEACLESAKELGADLAYLQREIGLVEDAAEVVLAVADASLPETRVIVVPAEAPSASTAGTNERVWNHHLLLNGLRKRLAAQQRWLGQLARTLFPGAPRA